MDTLNNLNIVLLYTNIILSFTLIFITLCYQTKINKIVTGPKHRLETPILYNDNLMSYGIISTLYNNRINFTQVSSILSILFSLVLLKINNNLLDTPEYLGMLFMGLLIYITRKIYLEYLTNYYIVKLLLSSPKVIILPFCGKLLYSPRNPILYIKYLKYVESYIYNFFFIYSDHMVYTDYSPNYFGMLVPDEYNKFSIIDKRTNETKYIVEVTDNNSWCDELNKILAELE